MSWLRDLKYCLRGLRKAPVFVIAAAVTLGIGIGVNTAIFSSMDSMMLRPMPVKNGRNLIILQAQDNGLQFSRRISYPEYDDYRKLAIFRATSIDCLTVTNFKRGGVTDRLWVEAVSGSFFPMLGLRPAAGRLFGGREESSPLLVLSYSYWKGKLGGDPGVIGSSVRLNAHDFTIIGIAPSSFHGAISYVDIDGFVPVKVQGLQLDTNHRDYYAYRILGRLKPGISLNQARAAAALLGSALEKQYPATNKGVRPIIMAETDSRPDPQATDTVRPMLVFGMALVLILLLIACANVANLLLVRTANRSREFAIRASLGATRAQMLRLIFGESSVLALAGLGAGLLLSSFITGWLNTIQPGVDFRYRMGDYSLDRRILAFTIAATALTALVCGLFPAWRVTRWDLNQIMKQGSGTGSSRLRGSDLLVIAQIAASVVLLIAAGLCMRALSASSKIDVSYAREGREVFSFNLSKQSYNSDAAATFERRLLDRVRALPGTTEAALVEFLPFTGFSSEQIMREGEPSRKLQSGDTVMYNVVSPHYFRTAGTRLLAGRDFSEHDDSNSRPVAVVNAAFARHFWPDQPAIGKRFRLGSNEPLVEIIGIVQTGKYFALGEAPRPLFFLPFWQHPVSNASLMVHSAAPVASVITAVRAQFHALDPELPVYGIMTMKHLIEDSYVFSPYRYGTQFATAFGLAGLLMAAIGIYGVISYSVAQRTREIGIRIGLGADRNRVLAMIMRQGLQLILAGGAIGLALAYTAAALFGHLMSGVKGTDPLAFGTAGVLILATGLIASYLPSRAAASVDPVIALRNE